MNFPASQFNYLQQMDLIIRMEMALAGDGNLVVHCLKQAIRQQRPAKLILQTTKDMIRDNETAIQDILGVALTHRIKNFEI